MKEISVFTGTRNIDISLKDENFLYYAEHEEYIPSKSEEEIIVDALDNPIGSASLTEVPKDANVAIIVDDLTRPTPTAKIIPYIVERLEQRTSNITFITAPGTHRPLTDEELEIKIGKEYIDKYKVVNIDYTILDDYEYFGESEMGTPLHFHKSVLEADYKIAIGNINPHNVVGWSGGAKMLMPGVSGETTTSSTHLAGVKYHVLDVFGNIDCRMRKEVDDIGGDLGLDFIANTILDGQNILGLFCGHYIEAHRAGVKFGQKVLRPEIPELADVVIVSAFPSNIDYWQGFKPIGFSMFGVKKGGTIIYLFDAEEGLCGNSPSHKPTLEKYLKKDLQIVTDDFDAGKVEDTVGITNPIYHFQLLDHVKDVIVLTEGLTDEECDTLSFTRKDTIEEALELAFEQQGQDAKVGIIPVGGETLVRVKE